MTVQETAAWLRQHDRYLILTHKRPDGDTLGCGAGLCAALRALGKTAYLLPNDGVTDTYAPYAAPYWAPEGYAHERVVSVDVAALGLLPANAEPYKDCIALAIDHHPSHGDFAGKSCVDADRAACGELIYDICMELGVMNEEIALPLYVAVSTDCGCFVYSNTTAACHRIAADLLDCGIDFMPINRRHFRAKSFKRMKLESMLMDSMQLFDEGTMAMVTLTLAMMEQLDATEEDVDNISAFVGQVEGVKTGITVRQMEPTCCKISVRTYPADLNASEVCARLGGGGHAAAAGVTLNMGVQEACEAIIGAVRAVQNGKE